MKPYEDTRSIAAALACVDKIEISLSYLVAIMIHDLIEQSQPGLWTVSVTPTSTNPNVSS